MAGLKPAQLKLIAERISQGRCVAFLGAAVNVKCANPLYEGLLLGAEVSKELAKELDPGRVLDPTNLAKVSLILERQIARDGLVEKMKKLLPEQLLQPSHGLKALAALPFDLYVTTNYDRLLESALAPRNPIVVVQTATGIEGEEQIVPWSSTPKESRRPLVYKIHGTFKDAQVEEPGGNPVERSPLILTEDDYIDFLTRLASREEGIPRVISAKLKTSVLLFLGYSLEDWDFRTLYKIVMKSFDADGQPPARYSVQYQPAEEWKRFWDQQKVEIVDQDVYAFIDSVAAAYQQYVVGGV